MNWRPHTESPSTDEPFTALIAQRDPDEGDTYLRGIYMWHKGAWRDEINAEKLDDDEPYWWLLEEELLATLPSKTAT
jgi:hypothetical protein